MEEKKRNSKCHSSGARDQGTQTELVGKAPRNTMRALQWPVTSLPAVRFYGRNKRNSRAVGAHELSSYLQRIIEVGLLCWVAAAAHCRVRRSTLAEEFFSRVAFFSSIGGCRLSV